jgi:hypothetical protein
MPFRTGDAENATPSINIVNKKTTIFGNFRYPNTVHKSVGRFCVLCVAHDALELSV